MYIIDGLDEEHNDPPITNDDDCKNDHNQENDNDKDEGHTKLKTKEVNFDISAWQYSDIITIRLNLAYI